MTPSTYSRLVGLVLIFIITAAIGTGIVQSQSGPPRIIATQATQSESHSAVFDPNGKYLATAAPMAMFMRPCKPRSTIGGRLTRRTDVFGDEVPQYRPVKGEQVFLWDTKGDEIARTRTDRDGDYSFPNLCSGTYTVHPGLASPHLPSRYDPSSRTTTVPARINQVASPLHLDFVRKQPPPPRQPDFPGHGE
jgi:hypothetical protein